MFVYPGCVLRVSHCPKRAFKGTTSSLCGTSRQFCGPMAHSRAFRARLYPTERPQRAPRGRCSLFPRLGSAPDASPGPTTPTPPRTDAKSGKAAMTGTMATCLGLACRAQRHPAQTAVGATTAARTQSLRRSLHRSLEWKDRLSRGFSMSCRSQPILHRGTTSWDGATIARPQPRSGRTAPTSLWWQHDLLTAHCGQSSFSASVHWRCCCAFEAPIFIRSTATVPLLFSRDAQVCLGDQRRSTIFLYQQTAIN